MGSGISGTRELFSSLLQYNSRERTFVNVSKCERHSAGVSPEEQVNGDVEEVYSSTISCSVCINNHLSMCWSFPLVFSATETMEFGGFFKMNFSFCTIRNLQSLIFTAIDTTLET